MEKKYDDVEDFGFSFETESSTTIDGISAEMQKNKENFFKYHNLMKKFLERFTADSDKTMIRWPNRVEEVEKLLMSLDALYDGMPIDESPKMKRTKK